MPSLGLDTLGRLNRFSRMVDDIVRQTGGDSAAILAMTRNAPTPAAAAAAGAAFYSTNAEAVKRFVESIGPESLELPPHEVSLCIIGLGLFQQNVLGMEVTR